MRCKICGSESEYFGNAKILKKYDIKYYHCPNCCFLQTEEPYWLEESYSSAITKSDIGLISRNISLSEKTERFILTCLNPSESYVDYGGGYGIFTRIMRDKGFNFFQHDPKCNNIFAEGFEVDGEEVYSLVTAWEVFEHLVDPISEIKKMLEFSRTILFSTTLIPSIPKPLGDWWYYGLEHGQHISFYADATLREICNQFNLSLLYSDGSIHLLSDKKINSIKIKSVFNNKYRIIQKILKKKNPSSLINQDFLKITGVEIK